jgi:hypothetical protein
MTSHWFPSAAPSTGRTSKQAIPKPLLWHIRWHIAVCRFEVH